MVNTYDLSSEMKARLKTLGIDTKLIVRAISQNSVVKEAIPHIIAYHFERMQGENLYRDFYEQHRGRLESQTIVHFQKLFESGFDTDYLARLPMLVKSETEAGHGTRYRLAISLRLLSHAFEKIGQRYPIIGPRIAADCSALMQVLLVDSLNSIGYEQYDTRCALEERSKKLDMAIETFSLDVTSSLTGVQSAASAVEVAAQNTKTTALSVIEEAKQSHHKTTATRDTIMSTAAATSEMAVSIAEIDHVSARSHRVVSMAQSATVSTERTMQSLQNAIEKIGSVVGMIDSIAYQTNLLALNATIEAARAGEAGRGFAVVAGEVKQLANQTGKSTQEISQHIRSIESEMAKAMSAIGSISETMNEVVQNTAMIATTMQEQSAATKEIEQSISNAARHTEQVVASLERMQQTMGQTGRVSDDMYDLSRSMATEAARFDRQLSHFVNTLRAL